MYISLSTSNLPTPRWPAKFRVESFMENCGKIKTLLWEIASNNGNSCMIYLPGPSNGWCLIPKGLLNGTPTPIHLAPLGGFRYEYRCKSHSLQKSDLKIQVAAIGAWDPSREALEAKRRAKGEVGGPPQWDWMIKKQVANFVIQSHRGWFFGTEKVASRNYKFQI